MSIGIKRIIGIITALTLLLGMGTVYAADTYVNSETHNIYVEGKAEGTNTVTLKMINKTDGSLGYIAEIDSERDGTYSYKFKFSGDVQNYALMINDGAENITSSVLKTADEVTGLVGAIKVKELKDNIVSLDADIVNKYADEGNCRIIVGSYDKDGNLISAQVENMDYGYFGGSITLSKPVESDAYEIKAFMWASMENCIPLALPDKALPEKDVILIGDSLGQAYSEDNIRKGWGEYIGNYMAYGAIVNNQCHAGWNTNTYIADTESGWDYSKQFIGEGDIVIFGIGYNDYGTMGYNGKYYDIVDGKKKLYCTGGSGKPYDGIQYASESDEKGKYIVSADQGKIYLADGINLETEKSGMMTYLYKDDAGKLSSYAADCFCDNMREMLDYCKSAGAQVVIRNIAAICSKKAQSLSDTYYGYVTQVLINERIPEIAKEYDNVTAIDLYTETKAHFEEIYNNAADDCKYFYDNDGNILPYIRSDKKLQQLADKYWITVKNMQEFYEDGYVAQNSKGAWGYITSSGTFIGEDTLHYNGKGADYIASATAKLIKESNCPAKEYFR